MKAAGAAILGAAVVGMGVLVASQASAEPLPPIDEGVDFDIDEELMVASNYYANALTNPIMWSDGQLKSLEGLLVELGMIQEAGIIRDLRIGLYGETAKPPEPLPDITFIPSTVIDAIADRVESEIG